MINLISSVLLAIRKQITATINQNLAIRNFIDTATKGLLAIRQHINIASISLLSIRKYFNITTKGSLARRKYVYLGVSMNLISYVFEKTKFECETIKWVRFPRVKIEIK